MDFIDTKRTTYRLTDLMSWQKEGSLVLSPNFQRRSVWKPAEKSYLLDTVVRGLPVPIFLIRERVDLKTRKTIREVVDGQQRLRTLFSFVDESLIKDFNLPRDRFTIRSAHNAEVANTTFDDLTDEVQKRIIGYELSTHVLPPSVEDREILQMFARLNATGVKLNDQELRNAEWFGAFKTLMYTLAFEQLERWRNWHIFSEQQLARMKEVELVSDVAVNVIDGLSGKSQKKINSLYGRLDDAFPEADELARRVRKVMDAIDETLGDAMSKSAFQGESMFVTLFTFFYDEMFELGSKLSRKKPKVLPKGLRTSLLVVSANFQDSNVPPDVLDAIQRAPTDIGRRRTRLKYLKEQCLG